jgi:hypothetical protein
MYTDVYNREMERNWKAWCVLSSGTPRDIFWSYLKFSQFVLPGVRCHFSYTLPLFHIYNSSSNFAIMFNRFSLLVCTPLLIIWILFILHSLPGLHSCCFSFLCFSSLGNFKSNSILDQRFYIIPCNLEYFKLDAQGNGTLSLKIKQWKVIAIIII